MLRDNVTLSIAPRLPVKEERDCQTGHVHRRTHTSNQRLSFNYVKYTLYALCGLATAFANIVIILYYFICTFTDTCFFFFCK